MTYFNPLTGAPLQGGQVQEQLAAAKARQVRRAQAVARNVAAAGDTFEHQVESTEELSAIRDEQQPKQQSDPRQHPQGHGHAGDGDEPPPSLDGWEHVGGGEVGRERQRFPIDSPEPHRYWLVWITKLPPDSGKVEIDEIVLYAPKR